jgi:hydroxymethylpyrimidine/phosphomethylpyrimidine kinase
MLATAELVEAVAGAIRRHRLGGYVLDPVMVATSGDRLLDEDAVGAVVRALVPLAALVTPNLHEARILTGLPVDSLEGMRDAARSLVRMGAAAALVKGGHLAGTEAVDLLWDGSVERVWRRGRIDTVHTHGTGCTLSAAIAALLAQGLPLREAVQAAKAYLTAAIEAADQLNVGSGHGPVHHFHALWARKEPGA